MEYEYYEQEFARQENAMAQKRFLVLTTLLFVSAALFGQSNEQIDVILEQEQATAGAAAYVALTSADLLTEDADFEQAVTTAQAQGWLADTVSADDAVTFGQFSYLMMAAHEMSGGLMYLIAPGPRYAAREFVYQEWSPVQRSPGATVTGEFLLQVTGRFLESVEATL